MIVLSYSGGAQEVIFERVETQPTTVNHASWQIGRKIKMYVQPLSSDNLLTPSTTSNNASTPPPRLIENL